jgi:DnaJ family protein C protein 28
MNEKPEKPVEQTDGSEDTQDKLAEHRARMRHDWSNLIEDLIQEGRRQGMFDNLPGAGKPLKLNRNPFGQDKELAHDLLQKNDLQPAWIMQRNDLLAQIKTLRQAIQHSWNRHQRAYQYAATERIQRTVIISWDDDCLAWESQIRELNKQIDSYNLKRPGGGLELFKLRLAEELGRIEARRWLKGSG